jgi:hypothetical protein
MHNTDTSSLNLVFPQLLLVVLGTFVFGKLLPLLFKIFERRRSGISAIENHADAILLLVSAAVVAGLGFWYPVLFFERHPELAERSGLLFLWACPFYVFGAVMAWRGLIRLREAARARLGSNGSAIKVVAVLWALFALNPALVLARFIWWFSPR